MSQESPPRIAPREVRHIKLGRGGRWVDVSLDRGEVHFGFSAVPHEVARTGDREEIRGVFLSKGMKPGVATGFAREVIEFYMQPRTTLWITFARDLLWWCFAEPEVIPLHTYPETGVRMRKTVDGWHHQDRFGHDLRLQTLSTRLTKTAAFRATICRIDSRDYLLRRLNGDDDPAVSDLLAAQQGLRECLATLIQELHWRDFEIMIDLVFARLGWQRVSVVGETMRDVDLVLEQPITRERGLVQVKSAAHREELEQFAEAVEDMGAARAWFVVHSPRTTLGAGEGRLEVWGVEHVARAVEKAGLVEWLIDRFR